MQYYLSKDSFQTALLNPKLLRLDRVLLVLYWENETPKSISKIKEIATENGLREIQKWNISDTLVKGKGRAALIRGDWNITVLGKAYLSEKKFINENKSILTNDVSDLRLHLSIITNSNTKNFLEEAIICLETDQKRAAVVFSWIGAVSLLYENVIKNHLATFNRESIRRDSKWKIAKTTDDLARMKEGDFLMF